MSALQKFKTFFSKNVLLCLTVPMVVFSLLVPQPFVWMGQNISIDLFRHPVPERKLPSFGFVNMLLCVIMFGMGMTLKADDFKYIFKKPTDVLIGICSQYVFMAGFGWLVASLLSLTGVGDPTVRAQIAVGLVLLGCVPGGTASNVMTFLAKGDVALSITITMCTIACARCSPRLSRSCSPVSGLTSTSGTCSSASCSSSCCRSSSVSRVHRARRPRKRP